MTQAAAAVGVGAAVFLEAWVCDRWSGRLAAAACGACDHCGGIAVDAAPWGLFDPRHHCRRNPSAALPACAGVLAGLSCLTSVTYAGTAFSAGALLFLAAIAAIDFREGVIPDFITVPMLFAGLAIALFFPSVHPPEVALAGALCGWFVPSAAQLIFRSWSGRHGIGGGDVKALAAIGCWFGAAGLAWTLALGMPLLAIWIGRARLKEEYRLGPLLFFGSALYLALRPLFPGVFTP